MPFIDNLNYLREHFPSTYRDWKEIESVEPTIQVQCSQAKRAGETLIIKQDDIELYLHSKYDSFQEAHFLVNNLKDVNEYSHAIFYGMGLGYHIQFFHELYPEIPITVYEPIPDIFRACVKSQKLESILPPKVTNVFIESNTQKTNKFFNEYIERVRGKVLIVELPSYKRIFAEKNQQFLKSFQNILKEKKSELVTEVAFQKRWVINSIKNFKYVLQTPNLLHFPKDYFSGKPAIIVSAGPSLIEEIENLRYIKENGLAYIFSVGKAIRTLLEYDLYPDVICSYDPRPTNHLIFKSIIENQITGIPLLFGSSVGYELVEQYPGKKMHILISQDTISSYYFENNNGAHVMVEQINDAASIAVIMLQSLYKLGCSPIILVGQNLAYKDNLSYAEGLKKTLSEEQMVRALKVEDVYGNQIYTSVEFNTMRKQLEIYLESFEDTNIINTTKGGAKIQGTTFLPLEQVIGEQLRTNINDLSTLLKHDDDIYNYQMALKKNNILRKAYQAYYNEIRDFQNHIDRIHTYTKMNDYNKASKHFSKLSKTIKKLEKNDFFRIVIHPMMRVTYQRIWKNIDVISEEQNLIDLINKAIQEYQTLIDLSNRCYDEIKEHFIEMQQDVEEIVNGE